MGRVNMGVPQKITLDLARLNNSKIFIETGTLHGGTTRWASNYFDIVHTIERSETFYELHSEGLSKIEGVYPHLGDSRRVLPQIVEELGDNKAIYWLDGHWSGGETAGENDECPLLDELECLSKRTQDIILIDDARLFMCAPPPPHKPYQWPNLQDIFDSFTSADRFVQIIDDVIFIIPNKNDLKDCVINYAQTDRKPQQPRGNPFKAKLKVFLKTTVMRGAF